MLYSEKIIEYVNPDDSFLGDDYIIISGHLLPDFIIRADKNDLQSVIDIWIDYCEDKKYDYFLSEEELEELNYRSDIPSPELEEYVYGGNHCRYMNIQWHYIGFEYR